MQIRFLSVLCDGLGRIIRDKSRCYWNCKNSPAFRSTSLSNIRAFILTQTVDCQYQSSRPSWDSRKCHSECALVFTLLPRTLAEAGKHRVEVHAKLRNVFPIYKDWGGPRTLLPISPAKPYLVMATRTRFTTRVRDTVYPESTSPPTRVWFRKERRRPEFEKAVKDAQYDAEQLRRFWQKQADYAQRKADYWRRVREKDLEKPEVRKWDGIQEQINREKRKYLQRGRRVISRMKSALRIVRGR